MTRRVALVTGGSRGIGQALVKKFQAEQWDVATCSSSSKNLIGSSAELSFQCDVSDVNQVKQGIARVIAQFGKIDALVNNAGLAGTNRLETDASDDLWHQIMNVNLHGSYYMCKYAAPYIPDHTGRIVNIASILALKGVPDQTAYCAAKHGVLGFTRAYAHHVSSRRITVNAVCPGWTRTEMAASRICEIGLETGLTEKAIIGAVPLGRFVEPKEVADLVYFLCASEGAAMITGQALTVDGGVLG